MGDGPRVGVFGGAFDPPHLGHLAVARAAAEGASLDRVLWVPAAVPPHKQGRVFASADARRRMVKAAIRDEPDFEVCDLELERGGISYTVDTLRALRSVAPEWRLFLIVGADLLPQLPSWKAPEEILELAVLVTAARGGTAPVHAAGEMELRPQVVPMPRVDVSSSAVRKRVAERAWKRVAEKKSHSAMLPSQVTSIIETEGLYRRRTAGFGRASGPRRRTPSCTGGVRSAE